MHRNNGTVGFGAGSGVTIQSANRYLKIANWCDVVEAKVVEATANSSEPVPPACDRYVGWLAA